MISSHALYIQSRLPAASAVVKCLHLHTTLLLNGEDSLCIIKLNNMGVQYTISQYLSALVNVDVKTTFKVQNPTKNKLFMV